MKRGAIAAAAFSIAATLAGTAYAETMTLGCSGIVVLEKSSQLPKTASFVVDIDAGVVSSSLGEFEIFRTSPIEVDFRADFFEENKRTGQWIGGLDRITGAISLSAIRRSDSTQPIIYNFQCQPRPLS